MNRYCLEWFRPSFRATILRPPRCPAAAQQIEKGKSISAATAPTVPCSQQVTTTKELSVPGNTRYGVAPHFLISSLHQPSKLHVLYTSILSLILGIWHLWGCNPLSLFVLHSAILSWTCLIAKYSDSIIAIHNNWERTGAQNSISSTPRHHHSTSCAAI